MRLTKPHMCCGRRPDVEGDNGFGFITYTGKERIVAYIGQVWCLECDIYASVAAKSKRAAARKAIKAWNLGKRKKLW